MRKLHIYSMGDPSNATKLCTESISSLGWDNEKLIEVKKYHGKLTMYPHRGDTDSQGFFESFMRTISELVDHTCPPAARNMWPSDELEDSVATWTMIPELSQATSALRIEVIGKCFIYSTMSIFLNNHIRPRSC